MHEGHRQRMYEKLKNDDGLNDHELLEILLFNALPRINTNPIAHNLINTFGSLAGVFNAETEQLTTVSGVGESTALYLKCLGECNKRISSEFQGVAVLKNHNDFKNFVCARLRGKSAEVVELYCLDKMCRVRRILSYTNDDFNSVSVESNKIVEALVTVRAYGVTVAHNHLSGSSKPSKNDDVFTAKFQLICSMNNINLLDHLIYASDKEIFSYFMSGKLDAIKSNLSFNSVLNDKLEKLFGDNK